MACPVSRRLEALTKPALLKPTSSSASNVAFDAQKGLQTFELGCIPERLLFTKEKLTVKAGRPVKLIFTNPDATQHNLVILAQGTPIEKIGMAANEMAKTPAGLKKHFVPKDKRILHATKLLNPDSLEVLRFTAPKKPGVYPYVCTFPGHWVLMKGELIVK